MTTDSSLEPVTMTPARETRKRGFTLTEIAIVLGIVGLILGAIWVAAAAVYNNLRVSHANTAILQTAQAVRALYATSNSVGTAGDITTAMISANAIPSDLVSSATTAVSVWPGGTTNVLTKAATDTAFTVQMTNMPQAGCINLMTNVGGTNRDQGLVNALSTAASAPIAAGTVGTAPTPGTAQIAVITPAAATTACSTSPTFVQFTFSLR